MSVENKRTMERFDLNLPAYLTRSSQQGSEETIELETSDICAGGAFFRTDKPLPIGTEVDVDVVLPLDELKKLRGDKVLIKVSGSVVRIDDEGIAVSFDKKYSLSPLQD